MSGKDFEGRMGGAHQRSPHSSCCILRVLSPKRAGTPGYDCKKNGYPHAYCWEIWDAIASVKRSRGAKCKAAGVERRSKLMLRGGVRETKEKVERRHASGWVSVSSGETGLGQANIHRRPINSHC